MVPVAPPPSVPIPTECGSPQSLWHRYQAPNDSSPEEELVIQHLPLVKTIVGRLAMTLPPSVNIEDLQSAGAIGLLHAIRNYDPSNGASFETYARFRIRGAVMDELRRCDWASRTARDKARRIQAAVSELESRNQAPPSERETAVHLGIGLDEYQRWLEEIRPTTFVCLDSVSSGSDEECRDLAEIVSDPLQDDPHDIASRREMIDLIGRRIRSLPEIQRKVLALYYVEDLRLREIAEAFGLTESRISQIHSQAIISIRSHLDKMERGINPSFFSK